MSNLEKRFSIQSYIDENREKIDESLVSLRIMKEIDKFLDYENITNKDLANNLGYSESYISQLMSGVKNVNVAFINKFEKKFSNRFEFRIFLEKDEKYLQKLDERKNFKIQININRYILNEEYSKFSFAQKKMNMVNISNVEFQNF
jgi:transcriptional regulator with XRE-family HTH domain